MLAHEYTKEKKRLYAKIIKWLGPVLIGLNLFWLFTVALSASPIYTVDSSPILTTGLASRVYIKPPFNLFKIKPKPPALNIQVKQTSVKTYKVDLKLHKKKVDAVYAFLKRYNAPLAKNAEDFVSAAEKYKLDYRLLPAISIVESSGGKYLFKPYNPFGWGKHGYPSFKAAIYDVARGMSVYYYKLGLKDPRAIAYKYNPVTPQAWGSKVYRLMQQMPKY